MAQNKLFNKLVNKMKVMVNQVGSFNSTRLIYGGFYKTSYQNYHRDPNPLIFCMGQYQGQNGKNYTHAFNCNYLMEADRQWLTRMIYLLNKSAQSIDARSLYNMIKIQRPSIIKSSYRVYLSNLIKTPKLISAGLTSMYSLVYTVGVPGWLAILNKNIQPNNMPSNVPQRIAINTSELQERITMAKNAIPLNQARVVKPTPFGGNFSSPFGAV